MALIIDKAQLMGDLAVAATANDITPGQTEIFRYAARRQYEVDPTLGPNGTSRSIYESFVKVALCDKEGRLNGYRRAMLDVLRDHLPLDEEDYIRIEEKEVEALRDMQKKGGQSFKLPGI